FFRTRSFSSSRSSSRRARSLFSCVRICSASSYFPSESADSSRCCRKISRSAILPFQIESISASRAFCSALNGLAPSGSALASRSIANSYALFMIRCPIRCVPRSPRQEWRPIASGRLISLSRINEAHPEQEDEERDQDRGPEAGGTTRPAGRVTPEHRGEEEQNGRFADPTCAKFGRGGGAGHADDPLQDLLHQQKDQCSRVVEQHHERRQSRHAAQERGESGEDRRAGERDQREVRDNRRRREYAEEGDTADRADQRGSQADRHRALQAPACTNDRALPPHESNGRYKHPRTYGLVPTLGHRHPVQQQCCNDAVAHLEPRPEQLHGIQQEHE